MGLATKNRKVFPIKTDEAQQEAFRKHYEVLKAHAGKDDVILFIDAVHPTQATKLSRTWIRKGYNKPILTTGSRTRVNLIGCIQLGHLSETLVNAYDKVNAEAIQDFLQRILDQYKDKKTIHLILDGAGYHKAAEVIKKANELKINLHFLPPYSPNLNPIERLWKVMNETIRNNITFPDAKAFRKSINDFFYKILPEIGNALDVRINDCFQRI